MEDVQILRVDTGEAVRSVNDLKENIAALKTQLGTLEIGSEEYSETLIQLKTNQYALKEAMYATNTAGLSQDEVMAQLTKESQGLSTSYNGLVKQMADAKNELRTLEDPLGANSERFKELSQKINSYNEQLKAMDAAQGNFQRNVGNYKSALDGMSEAFRATAGNAGAVINPLKNMTVGLKTLSATPVIAILGLLANIIGKVIDAMKKSEESTGALTKAFSAFGAITDVLNTLLQKVGDAVAWVVGKFGDLASTIFKVKDAQAERIAVTQEELSLAERQRKQTMENAEIELEVAKLKAQAAEKDKCTNKERVALLQKAADLEKKMSRAAYEDAKTAYEIQKRKNALAASSAEEKKKEADAYAAMIKAETAYYVKVKETTSQIAEARKAMAAEALQAAKRVLESKKAEITAQRDLITQQIELARKGSKEQLKLMMRRRAAEYALAVEDTKTKITDQEILDQTLLNLEKKLRTDMSLIQQEHRAAAEKQEILALQNTAAVYERGSEQYLRAMADVSRRKLQIVRRDGQLLGETQEEYLARELAAQQEYENALRAIRDKGWADERQARQNATAEIAEGSLARFRAEIEYKQWELSEIERIGRLEAESDEEYASRRIAAEKAVTDAKKAYTSQQLSLAQQAVSITTSILGSIADIMEASGDDSEENAERIKGIRIASAMIDTIMGAVGAYMQAAATIPPPAGPIFGAAQAAAVTATGMAQIAAMKSTSTTGSSTAATAPAITAAPKVVTTVPQTAILTNATQEHQLTASQKVYILESDLQAASGSQKAKVQESTF